MKKRADEGRGEGEDEGVGRRTESARHAESASARRVQGEDRRSNNRTIETLYYDLDDEQLMETERGGMGNIISSYVYIHIIIHEF